MDLSALIFVALAVAWAVYLVPKALKHHEEVAEARTVDRFSHTMRVLARREPVDRKSSRLVVTPARPGRTAATEEAPVEPGVGPGAGAESVEVEIETSVAVSRPIPASVRRAAAARAAKRRRRVLSMITAVLGVVSVLAIVGVVSGWYVVIPAVLLVAWLVACRLMVRQERAVRPAAPLQEPRTIAVIDEETGEIAVIPAAAAPTTGPGPGPGVPVEEPVLSAPAPVDPSLWDPVPVTLPTYVSKPAATRRTVRTIDLDDTGVWTSGRSAADSQLAREADQAQRAERDAAKGGDEGHRAVGS